MKTTSKIHSFIADDESKESLWNGIIKVWVSVINIKRFVGTQDTRSLQIFAARLFQDKHGNYYVLWISCQIEHHKKVPLMPSGKTNNLFMTLLFYQRWAFLDIIVL